MSVLTSIKTVTDFYAKNTYMDNEDKMRAIRLNINFMIAYPEFFDFVMRAPADIFFGHTVLAKSLALKTEHLLEITRENTVTHDDLVFPEAFEELAAHWRLLKAQGNTVLPYLPIELTRTVAADTFQPKIGFKTRFGTIDAVP